MPSISVSANVGGPIAVDVAVTITDTIRMADFTKALISQESVDWVISAGNLSSKNTIVLRTFNGLLLIAPSSYRTW